MANGKLSSLVFPMTADGSGIRAELQAVKTSVSADTLTIEKALDNVGKAAKRQQGQIRGLSREFLVLGGEATKGLGMAHGAAQSLLGAFASGGAMGLGVMVLTQSVALLTEHLAQTKRETEQLGALSRVYGITAGEVAQLEGALAGAGVQVDRLASQRLTALAKEAGVSADEVGRVAKEARDLAAINGTSIETEITNRLQESSRRAADLAQHIADVTARLYELRTGHRITAWESQAGAAVQAYAEAYAAKLEAAEAKIAKGEADLEKALTPSQRYIAQDLIAAGRRARAAAMRGDDPELKALANERDTRLGLLSEINEAEGEADRRKKAAEEEKRQAAERDRQMREALRETERRAEEERRKAAARDAAAMQATINLAEHRRDREGAINARLEQRLAVLRHLRDKGEISEETFGVESTIATEAAEREKTAIVTDAIRARQDAEAAYRAQLASLTESQVDDLELAQERALEAVQRRIDDEVLAEEEGAREIARIRDYYARRIEQQKAKEDEAAARRRDEAARRQEAEVAAAFTQGAAIAAAFTQGMRQALEKGDTAGVVRSVLGLVAGGLSFLGPVGAAAGFGLSAISGFFADGGLVGGIGGPKEDRNIVAVSRGEFIHQESAVRKFGVPFMEALNAGVLDLSKLPAFASGGLVGQGAMTAAAPAFAGAPINVHFTTLAPAEAAAAWAEYLAPAFRGRLVAQGDERVVQALRRRTQPPRSTR